MTKECEQEKEIEFRQMQERTFVLKAPGQRRKPEETKLVDLVVTIQIHLKNSLGT
jgi:hypothetical protein